MCGNACAVAAVVGAVVTIREDDVAVGDVALGAVAVSNAAAVIGVALHAFASNAVVVVL